MDLDNFIIGKTKERRGEIWQKKQQLLSKHRAAVDGKNSQKTEERGAFDEHPHLICKTKWSTLVMILRSTARLPSKLENGH